ncbi:hypothetical protein LU632_26195 (plasmid) [Erwinia tracheiphila]|nr:hypothetical protein [Erwinia tracheiphila]UIA94559.1 hypothetical protein LU632_26195 [Erwinia tracheiphila]
MNEILKLGGLQKHLYTEMQKQGMMTPEPEPTVCADPDAATGGVTEI